MIEYVCASNVRCNIHRTCHRRAQTGKGTGGIATLHASGAARAVILTSVASLRLRTKDKAEAGNHATAELSVPLKAHHGVVRHARSQHTNELWICR